MPDDPGRRIVLGLVAASLALPARLAAQDSPPGRWQIRAPMPWPAQEIYCARLGDLIVTAGGLVGHGNSRAILDRTAIYDPVADRWTRGPRLPAPRHHLALVATGGRIWAFGGYAFAGEGEWVNSPEIWTFDGARWTEAGQMPEPQAETVALALDGRVHLVTGRAPGGTANSDWTDQADLARHRVFDPDTGRWSDAAPLPVALNSAAGAVVDGALHLVGGRTTALVNSDRHFRYDSAVDRWEEIAPLPPTISGRRGQGGLAAAAPDGRLVALGGEYFEAGGGGVVADVRSYDPAADRWSELAPMAIPRHGHAAIAFGPEMIVLGGSRILGTGATTPETEALVLS